MIQNTSISLNELREMDYKDFDAHYFCLMYWKEIEHELSQPKKDNPLKGSSKKIKTKINQQLDPESGKFVDI
jgi:hypothetical protein